MIHTYNPLLLRRIYPCKHIWIELKTGASNNSLPSRFQNLSLGGITSPSRAVLDPIAAVISSITRKLTNRRFSWTWRFESTRAKGLKIMRAIPDRWNFKAEGFSRGPNEPGLSYWNGWRIWTLNRENGQSIVRREHVFINEFPLILKKRVWDWLVEPVFRKSSLDYSLEPNFLSSQMRSTTLERCNNTELLKIYQKSGFEKLKNVSCERSKNYLI